ncbi:GGDEF domain-containing protein [Cognatishimia sp. WU-CL00825]|uniref:GGDEF domain-containing protein n=1 Tax=Cognatishimia sp. WU-CL00825 TaxID=3127658 RepID=UPI00310C41ED
MTMTSSLRQLCAFLDLLCPMHLVVSDTGEIQHVGPTLAKLRSRKVLSGLPFLEVFDLQRPRAIKSMDQMLNATGTRLHMRFCDAPQTGFQGVVVKSPSAEAAVINLSFGISVLDAVQDYSLTSTDFAATDLAIEMLYLVEAKSAAMEASRKLNHRLQSAMVAAEEQAFTDTLTGLKNRRAVDHILPRLMENQTGFAVMQMDLDFFKKVNDTKGHAAGDFVLQQVARILVEETREQDHVARVGGDEFVLVFEKTRSRKMLSGIAGRIIERIQEPMSFQGETCSISASIGIALWHPTEPPSPDQIVANADVALYACKNNGRGCSSFYEDLLGEEIGTALIPMPD